MIEKGIVKSHNMKGAEGQREFIEEISERLAGYSDGISFSVVEYEIKKTELFDIKADAFMGDSAVTLKLCIRIKE